MKKLLAIVLTFILALSLVACGASEQTVGTMIPDTGTMTLDGDPMAEAAEVVESDNYIREFDKDGNLLRTTSLYPDGSILAVSDLVYKKGVHIGTISTLYDETGAVTSTTELIMQNDVSFSYTYDVDRVLLYYSATEYGNSGSLTTHYDAQGNITRREEWATDGNGGSINYVYDADGELLATNQYDSSGKLVSSIRANEEWLDDHTLKISEEGSYCIEHYADSNMKTKLEYENNALKTRTDYSTDGTATVTKYD